MKPNNNLLLVLATLAVCGTSAAASRAPRGPDFEAHSTHRQVDRDDAASDADHVLLPVDIVHFEFDSTKLDRVDRIELLDAAHWLATHEGYHLVVEGYADATGPAAYNQDLAARRARIVRRQIVALGHLPRDRVVAVVFGERRPLGGPRALDRRVVLYATRMTPSEIVAVSAPLGYAVLWS